MKTLPSRLMAAAGANLVTPIPAVIQAVGNNVSGTSTSPSISAVKEESLLVACVCQYTGNLSPTLSVTDSAGQSWTAGTAVEALFQTNYGVARMFYFPNSEPITTVTAHSTQTGYLCVYFFEVTGIALASPADVVANTSGGGTTASSGSLTGAATAQNIEVAIGMVATAGVSTTLTPTGGDGWTFPSQESQSNARLQPAYQVLSSEEALTLAGSFSPNTYWADLFMTFKAI